MAPIRNLSAAFFKLVSIIAIAKLSLRVIAQEYASLPVSTPPADFEWLAIAGSVENEDTNRASLIHWATQPNRVSPGNFHLTVPRSNSLSSIIANVGSERAEAAYLSPRVLAEDSLLYMNRDPLVLRRPEDLAANRGEAIFGRTAAESLGQYLDANFRLGGIWAFLRETFLDYPFERRIVSPLSPVSAGNPGEARTGNTLLHFGLRNLIGSNPRGFITFRDRLEFDAAAKGPSLILRNPLGIDGSKIVTTLAAEYPNWNVNNSAIPRVGATVSILHGAWSMNLTASAGSGNFELTRGHRENRFEQRVLFYARRAF